MLFFVNYTEIAYGVQIDHKYYKYLLATSHKGHTPMSQNIGVGPWGATKTTLTQQGMDSTRLLKVSCGAHQH